MSPFQFSPTTEAFLDATRCVGELIACDEIGRAWPEPSALDLMTVGEVAGHVFLVVRRVGKRVEAMRPTPGSPKPASGSLRGWTWLRVDGPEDLERPDQLRVREDGAHVANWGWEALRDAYLARAEKVTAVLHDGYPGDVEISGEVISFDAYLATRIVELLVHADDLAFSVGLVASMPQAALEIAIRTLVDASRSIHGDLFVLRALSRRERIQSSVSAF